MTGPGPRRKGRLTVDGDDGTATLVFERVLDHSPAHVWDAITTPEGLRAWLMCTEARIDGRAGGTIELVTGPAGYRSTGRILAWDPPRLFEYEWKVAPVPEMPMVAFTPGFAFWNSSATASVIG